MTETFFYKARNRTGQLLTGSMAADSERAVAAYIREKGCFVIQIKKRRGKATFLVSTLRRAGMKDVALLCRQFATMLDAGVPLLTCLTILIEQSDNSLVKTALRDVARKVKEGEMLSRALSEHHHVFPDIMVNMVEAGETGGVLDDIFNRLAIHFEKEHKLNEKVKSALAYPAVVLSMALFSMAFILIFVLPTFTQMFAAMKMDIPLPTRVLLGISDFLYDYWLPVSGLMIAGALGSAGAVKQKNIRKIIDGLILAIPVLGMMVRKIAIARFSRTLSTLIRGGVPIISALEVVKKTMGNLSMIEALSRAQYNMKEGISLAQTLGSSKVFTPMAVRMIAIGEESGSLDNMLEKIADFYESDADDIVSRISSIMEPVLIGLLGVVIGFIVISLVLPLFDAMTNINAVM